MAYQLLLEGFYIESIAPLFIQVDVMGPYAILTQYGKRCKQADVMVALPYI